MPPRRVVFTALLGGYEELLEQPVATDDDVDYICFTDSPDLVSSMWRIELVEPLFATDLVRSQRALKIRGHELLDEYDEILYIDNSVKLKAPASAILSEWLDGADYAVSLHSYRERVIDEFDEVVALHYDDSARVQEQLFQYSEVFSEVLYQRPYWNGIIARRNTPEVRATMNLWFDHVLRYSRRDQLSANVAIAATGLVVRPMELDNFQSKIHAWPAEVQRKIHMGKASRKMSGPLLAEVARLERTTRELEEQLQMLEEQLSSAKRMSDELAQVNADLERRATEHRESAVAFEQHIQELHQTSSWKFTAPLRAVKRILANRKR